MDEKDREQTEDQGRNAFSRLLLVSFVVLVLYVVSTGPVLKFQNPIRRNSWIGGFYRPLALLSEQVPAINRFFEWYIYDLWKVPLWSQ